MSAQVSETVIANAAADPSGPPAQVTETVAAVVLALPGPPSQTSDVSIAVVFRTPVEGRRRTSTVSGG